MGERRWPTLGCGVGLRTEHYDVITREWSPHLPGAAEAARPPEADGPSGHRQMGGWPRVDWFEAVSENFMDSGGRPLRILEAVRAHYPVALHGVSLSIGSTDPLDLRYLQQLKELADRIDPAIVSDHLCWTSIAGEHLHDLLPLPFTEEALAHVSARVQQVQEHLGRALLLENVSTYVTYRHSTMPEWEFLTQVAKRSGCGILLDLNNLYVNAYNHQFDPRAYLDHIPGELVGQFHLAGHTDMGSYLFDTHNRAVIDEVWALYRDALARWGPVTTLIEWDEDIPPFPRLAEEADKARAISLQVLGALEARGSSRLRKHSSLAQGSPAPAITTGRPGRLSAEGGSASGGKAGPPRRSQEAGRGGKSPTLDGDTVFPSSLQPRASSQHGVFQQPARLEAVALSPQPPASSNA